MLRIRSCLVVVAILTIAAPSGAQIRQESLSLDGVNQYLSVTDDAELENLGSMTIEAWVHPTSFVRFPTIVGNGFQDSYWFGFSESGNLRFYPDGGAYVETPQTIPLDQWTHVAVAFKQGPGGLITFYINGVDVHSVATAVTNVGSSPGELRIGADRLGGSPDFFFEGLLDEVRIWNAPLTDVTIAASMFERVNNPGLGGGSYSGLLAYWDMEDPWPSPPDRHLDRAQGFGLDDNSAFFVNAPGSSSDAPPISYNTAVQFDGIDDYVHRSMPDGFGAGITIEAWVCPFSYAGFPTIVGRDFESSFWLGFNTGGQLRFYPTGGGGNYVQAPDVVATGQWHHVAATYRDGVARLYLNGSPLGVFTNVTGPVGENGRDIYIGADNRPGGPDFHMDGIIDHVTVTRGELSGTTIRRGMAYSIFAPFNETPDVTGVPRERMEFDLGHRSVTRMSGNPRFVQARTPRVAPDSPLWETDYTHGFDTWILGDAGEALATLAGYEFTPSVVINDVDVFVNVVGTDMSAVEIEIRHPDLTWVTLLAPGEAASTRDLRTVFDDDATVTFATSWPPYDEAVVPHEALSAFHGKSSTGTWLLHVAGGGSLIGIIAWGMSFNGITPLAVGDPAADGKIELEILGSNPVRGTGQLAFTIPEAGGVRLDLLDVQGRQVRDLLDGPFSAGRHFVSWNAAGLEAGVYFARLLFDGRESREVKVSVVR